MIRNEDFLFRDRVTLYNNLATSGNCQGRLEVHLEIYPMPRMLWDFESLGDSACTLATNESGKLRTAFTGSQFRLEEAYGSLKNIIGTVSSVKGYRFSGFSPLAWIGNKELRSDYFSFYLPNARCLVESHEGREVEENYRISRPVGKKASLEHAMPQWTGLGGWKCSLLNGWMVSFDFEQDAESWLKSKNSYGTYLTVKGSLYLNNDESGKTPAMLMDITLVEARELIGKLCWLLTFANGGYLGPILMQASHIEKHTLDEAAVIGVYRTTPLELLGDTWLLGSSNLCIYISCFPTFEKMMSQEPWNELFELVLIWYLQAIQPSSKQVPSKPWPVVANALGAALERLSVAILQIEFAQKPNRRENSKQKIRNLLKKIGVIEKDNDDYFVDVFVETRNNATHARFKDVYSQEDMHLSLQYATLWVEEAILWRLGYDGAYRRRIPGSRFFAFEKPRYNLNSRKPEW